jgi:hypothetical protein
VTDVGEAKEERGNPSGEASTVARERNGANVLTEREIAENDNERAQKNRQRFIYGPFRWFIWRRVDSVLAVIENHDGAVTAAATVVIAILTGVLAWYANGQEKILTQQIEDSRAEKRAFVFVDSFDVSYFAEIFKVSPRLKNSGTTPPVNMRTHDNWKWFPGEPPPQYRYPDLDTNGKETIVPENNPAFVGPQSIIGAAILNIPKNVTIRLGWDKSEFLFGVGLNTMTFTRAPTGIEPNLLMRLS